MEKKEKIIILVLILLGIATRFFQLNYPQEVVFDEVHFFNFIKQYNKGEYFFDIHPPLGKLTIFFMGWLSGFDFESNQVLTMIGDNYSQSVFWLRFIPALFGVLLIPLVFLFLKKISNSQNTAFLGAVLVLLENSFISQSKFILLDSQLVFFNILSLYSFFSFRNEREKKKKQMLLIATGLSTGIAVSIKLTALSIPAIILFFLIIDWLRKEKSQKKDLLVLLKNILVIISLISFIYIFSFYIHFKILTKPGPGNDFVPEEYRVGTSDKKAPFLKKFLNLNKQMLIYNFNITERHDYESTWYQWLFAQRPINYWENENATIYFAGNLFVWLTSTAVIILSFLYLLLEKKYLIPHFDFLMISYLANLLPFITIERCLFVYHYLTALVIAIMGLALFKGDFIEKAKLTKANKNLLCTNNLTPIIILISIVSFLYIVPITYGIETSPKIIKEILRTINFLKII